jgi:predicted AAA+ superfamily ATPase
VGGFPRAVEDHLRRGEVAEGTVRILWDVLAGDIDRAGYDRLTALALLDHAVRALGSPTSFRDLALEIAVGSPETAHRYVSLLGEAFALLAVYFWDTGRGRMALRKNKKLYLADPLFGAIPMVVQPGGPKPQASAMVEAVVAMGLYRAAESGMVEAFPAPQSLFYWHSKQRREIDFLSGIRAKKTALEVKYQGHVTGSDRLAIRNTFRRGLILSRADLDLDDPVRVIPAPIFLWLLGLRA